MEKHTLRIQCPSRSIGLCSENLLLVDSDGICRQAIIKNTSAYFNEQMLGKNIFSLFPASASVPLEVNFRAIQENLVPINEALYECKKEGEPSFYFLASMARQNSAHIIIRAKDLSTHINKHESLLLQEQKKVSGLRHMIDSMLQHIPVSLFVKDVKDDYKYLFHNRATLDFLQVPYKNIVGKNDYDLVSADQAEILRQEDQYVVTHQTRYERTKYKTDTKGNTVIWEQVKIYDQKEDGSPLVIGVGWDITARVQLEEALKRAKEEAEEAGRLKSAFLANMSHEIRTPLNAILGFSHIIAETPEIEERRGMYKIVETNNERLLSLINEILDLSKIEAGMLEFNHQPVNLQVLCNDVLTALSFRCPGNVIFSFDKQSPRLITQTDSNRLFQVFSNLITNAFKFTSTGEVVFGYSLEGEQIHCYVQDTGTGIEAHKLEKIFDRFVKGNDFAQGTGLGLPICKILIEKMGGTVSVASILGEGTRFTFTLPYTPPITGLPQEANAEMITILSVKNGSDYYDLLQDQFGERCFSLQAANGVEAITLFEQYRPQLIVVNLEMPDMDGLEMVEIMKEVIPDVSIIAVDTTAEQQEAMMRMGYRTFTSMELLQEAVEHYLATYNTPDKSI